MWEKIEAFVKERTSETFREVAEMLFLVFTVLLLISMAASLIFWSPKPLMAFAAAIVSGLVVVVVLAPAIMAIIFSEKIRQYITFKVMSAVWVFAALLFGVFALGGVG